MSVNHKSFAVAILFGLILLVSSCRKGSETAATTPQPAAEPAATADAAPKQRPHRLFAGNGPVPYIASISPETVVVHDGHAPMQRFTMAYEIDNPEKATKAEIEVKVPGIGQVHRSQIEIQPHAQVEFLVDASSFDLGPTVRLRAHCPSGDTDWLTLGIDPADASDRLSGQNVPTVSPLYIIPHGQTEAVQVSVSSPQITRGCTLEAKVDGQSVELSGIIAFDSQVRGWLPESALQGRSVPEHHFEVELVVYGAGMPRADVIPLRFTEQ